MHMILSGMPQPALTSSGVLKYERYTATGASQLWLRWDSAYNTICLMLSIFVASGNLQGNCVIEYCDLRVGVGHEVDPENETAG